jgi:hypothetical protein
MHTGLIILCLVLAIPVTMLLNKISYKIANTSAVLYISMTIYISYLFYRDKNMTNTFKKACYLHIKSNLIIGFSTTTITTKNWKSIALIIHQDTLDEVILGVNKSIIRSICETAGVKPENIRLMSMDDFINEKQKDTSDKPDKE